MFAEMLQIENVIRFAQMEGSVWYFRQRVAVTEYIVGELFCFLVIFGRLFSFFLFSKEKSYLWFKTENHPPVLYHE